MKKKPLSKNEETLFVLMRMKLGQDLLEDGWAPDDKAAAALVNNEALQMVWQARKREGSTKGGKATAHDLARPDLDQLIRGCLRRGEPTKGYVADWAEHFDLNRGTIYRHIAKVKQEK